MAQLNLNSVDELIAVRQAQHGGGRGAPRANADGTREGQALNRAVIVMTSAMLQAFCEDVFFELSDAKLGLDTPQRVAYRRLYAHWGNPSKENIRNQFRRLGAVDVLGGLSWQRCSPDAVLNNLDRLNQLRNQIAHGRAVLTIGNHDYPLSLAAARSYRNFVGQFGDRFENHARGVVGLPPVPMPA